MIMARPDTPSVSEYAAGKKRSCQVYVKSSEDPSGDQQRVERTSGKGGGVFALPAVEMLDQQARRIGIAMEEFDTDVEELGILALLHPLDPAVHAEKLIASFKVDKHAPGAADGKDLLADDPRA